MRLLYYKKTFGFFGATIGCLPHNGSNNNMEYSTALFNRRLREHPKQEKPPTAGSSHGRKPYMFPTRQSRLDSRPPWSFFRIAFENRRIGKHFQGYSFGLCGVDK
jgi:hypothetical protein